MKTLIFSDTHLSSQVDGARLNYIANLVRQADRVVINGDFWDYQLCRNFSEFVESGWRTLFPLLKAKQTIYIHGNHDSAEYCDQRQKLFSVRQVEQLVLKSGDLRLSIQHGHHEVPKFDGTHPELVAWLRRHMFGVVRGFTNLSLSAYVQLKLQASYHVRAQRELSAWVAQQRQAASQKTIYVFGHCHRPLFKPDQRIVIVGALLNGRGLALWVENGQLKHITNHYA